MNNKIYIFDTTLRDGEQAPKASLNIREKVQIALQLERLGVDCIEAGFPISSPGDLAAVQEVSVQIKNCSVAGLARCRDADIEAAAKALENAAKPMIHVFLATSEIHMKHKLKMNTDKVLELACKGVRTAGKYVDNVEFSAEDGSRSNPDFLCKVVSAVIDAGASVVNIPDTVGYTLPEEYGRLIRYVMDNVPNLGSTIISVHCHNDLGLGVANSLAAVRSGARQIECTINGLGERAGNAALEEVVMAIKTRKDLFCDIYTDIDTRQIVTTSRLVRNLTGIPVQPNKAIVGENAFAHESGIHQDGILKERTTYEIMHPHDVGWEESKLVLGKHSGRHAFRDRLSQLGFDLGENEFDTLFASFKTLADKKKDIYDEDLIALAEDHISDSYEDEYQLLYFCVTTGSSTVPTATITLVDKDGREHQDASCGDGPVDAVYKTIDRIVGITPVLKEYTIRSVTIGTDAQGEVVLSLEFDGKYFPGRASSTDTVEASTKAYLTSMNKIIRYQQLKQDRSWLFS